ncbi:YceI family protein [Porticoccaceae bacterium LTM1]|nr:YceI family protein [Porticoccaceae bacterium LTM1]
MKTLKNLAIAGFTALLFGSALPASAQTYKIDTKGAHAFIQFSIQHLGYSWLNGRFNSFDGHFVYDEANPSVSSVEVEIDVASIDSMHAERDKHLRSDEYLNVEKYPTASFKSTAFKDSGDGKASLIGNLTLRGVTKEISIAVEKVGSGESPWIKGATHAGFRGTVALKLADFGMKPVGPADTVFMTLDVEGIHMPE